MISGKTTNEGRGDVDRFGIQERSLQVANLTHVSITNCKSIFQQVHPRRHVCAGSEPGKKN